MRFPQHLTLCFYFCWYKELTFLLRCNCRSLFPCLVTAQSFDALTSVHLRGS